MAIKKRQQVEEFESSDEGGYDYESQEEEQSVSSLHRSGSRLGSNKFL